MHYDILYESIIRAANIPEIPIFITKMCPCNSFVKIYIKIEKQLALHFV